MLESCRKCFKPGNYRNLDAVRALTDFLRRLQRELPSEVLAEICKLEDFSYVATFSENTNTITHGLRSLEGLRAVAQSELERRVR